MKYATDCLEAAKTYALFAVFAIGLCVVWAFEGKSLQRDLEDVEGEA